MAEIVLGLASSHTPRMSTSAEFWKEHAARGEHTTQRIPADRSPAGTGVGMGLATRDRDRAARTRQEMAA
ncbi:hypothetical protein [Trebonia sp.]|uniref:hypothetical protein n=1 Tax=Trebonia sp. TaxID=2767075 RepID=UPI002607FC95|nr:hypothetical protein [Trebonia sp.]